MPAIHFCESLPNTASAVVYLLDESMQMCAALDALNINSGGLIKRACKQGFTGKAGQVHTVYMPEASGLNVVYLAGLGNAEKIDVLAIEKAAGAAIAVAGKHAEHVAFHVYAHAGLDESAVAAHVALAARLRSYRFDKYHTKLKEEDKPKLQQVHVVTADADAAITAYAPLEAYAEAAEFTRNIVTEPANIIHPESLAALCEGLTSYGLSVRVLNEKDMQALGMGALLGVGQGSVRESRMVALEWMHGEKGQQPVAFVGKGVCFDTGGISLKPAGGMEEMKWDMGGSAAVIGAMITLAKRKAKANVVGVVGLVENMPDGNAQRPGDVVTSMSGQTIEVLNTDAEGRLVLADALWWTQEQYKPSHVIDLATLTGAILVAIGSSRAGLFSNDDALCDALNAAATHTGEALWRFPLGDVYDKQIDSDIADMKNIGEGREAGSITAAQFLQRFIQDGVKWAHLDIAGTAWAKKDTAITPKGATAYGVRLLDAFIAGREGV